MKYLILCIITVFSLSSYADKSDSETKVSPNNIPMYYVSNIPNKEFIEKLQQKPLLKGLKTKLYGSPIYFRTTIQNHDTAGGSAGTFFSAMLAGGSLGIIPIVTNKDFVLRYEIFVNGEKLFDHQFTYNVTDVKNMFTGSNGNTLDPELFEWASKTIEEVAPMIQKDEKVQKLINEYQYYFSK